MRTDLHERRRNQRSGASRQKNPQSPIPPIRNAMDPSAHIIFCPNCRAELEVLSGMAESQAKCSACMTRFGLDAQLQPVPGDPAEPGGSMQMVRLLYPPSNEPPPTMTSQAERLPDAPRPRLKVIEAVDEEPIPTKAIVRRRERLFWAIVGSLLLLIVLAVLGWQLWRRYGSTGAAGSAAPPPTIPMTALSPPAPMPAIRPATGSGGRRPATRSSGTGARP